MKETRTWQEERKKLKSGKKYDGEDDFMVHIQRSTLNLVQSIEQMCTQMIQKMIINYIPINTEKKKEGS